MIEMQRRTLVRFGLTAAVLVPFAQLLAATPARAAALALDPDDPTAKALGYVAVSPKPDQKCGTCVLYQGKPDEPQGGCTIFAGKNVMASGWCKSWAKRP